MACGKLQQPHKATGAREWASAGSEAPAPPTSLKVRELAADGFFCFAPALAAAAVVVSALAACWRLLCIICNRSTACVVC
jgi:hypothetical protein